MNVPIGHMERPTPGQFGAAGILGIVFGALGAGFALALGLFLLIAGVLALWRIVTLLGYLAAVADDWPPTPTRTAPTPAGRGAGTRERRRT